MFDFLRAESFKVFGSAAIGMAIMVVLKPGCRSGDCKILKAPPIDEVTKSVYQIGSKCYKFETHQVECPKQGVIEPFEVARI